MRSGINSKILEKLNQMNNYLNELEDIFPGTESEYLSNLMAKRACEKTIELAIEAVIDIVSLIVSGYQLGFPDSEDSLINILEKKKVISPETTNRIKQMKGFRNILIHKYGEIDDNLTYDFLAQELTDFSLFEKEIRKFLTKSNLLKPQSNKLV